MKTKKVFILERICVYLINLIFLPISILYLLFYCLLKLFNYLNEFRTCWIENISHKLFLHCDEKEYVKNQYIYDRISVKAFYQWLKENNKI